MNNAKNSTMKMRVPGAKQAIDKMKYEIANEFGVNLGPDATSRANGTVGGEITRRLVQNGMNQVSGSFLLIFFLWSVIVRKREGRI